jgi:hypothetical protein
MDSGGPTIPNTHPLIRGRDRRINRERRLEKAEMHSTDRDERGQTEGEESSVLPG